MRYLRRAMKTIGDQIKTARQQRHLSQSALARTVGCKQSALSMFEGGRSTALSDHVIGRLCSELGLIAPTPAELASAPVMTVGVRTFCPNAQCPGNLPLSFGGQSVLVPHKHFAVDGEVHCAWCGEVLEKACPECGAAVNAGAFCVHCGRAYLTNVVAAHEVPVRIEQSQRLMAWSQ